MTRPGLRIESAGALKTLRFYCADCSEEAEEEIGAGAKPIQVLLLRLEKLRPLHYAHCAHSITTHTAFLSFAPDTATAPGR